MLLHTLANYRGNAAARSPRQNKAPMICLKEHSEQHKPLLSLFLLMILDQPLLLP